MRAPLVCVFLLVFLFVLGALRRHVRRYWAWRSARSWARYLRAAGDGR